MKPYYIIREVDNQQCVAMINDELGLESLGSEKILRFYKFDLTRFIIMRMAKKKYPALDFVWHKFIPLKVKMHATEQLKEGLINDEQ